MELTLEKLSENDIEMLIDLSASVGWDYDEAEIRTVLAAGDLFGHRSKEGRVVSSAAIFLYGDQLASIGMVIVHPDYQGLGLGKKLMERCIQAVDASVPIMLIATEQGKPLYERLGFSTVDHVHKCLCDNYESANPILHETDELLPLTTDDLPAIIRLDAKAVGADRTEFLTRRLQQSQQAVLLQKKDGSVVGFAFSIQGPANLVIGPLVAPDDKAASALFHSLVKDHKGMIRVDVTAGKEQFLAVLEQSGFTQVRTPPIMLRNADHVPLRNGQLYSIAAQAYG